MNLWEEKRPHKTTCNSFITFHWFQTASDPIVKQNLTLLTVQPVLWEDEEGAAGWRRGLGGHTVMMVVVESCESWRRVAETFLSQRVKSWQEVFQRFSSALGASLAHGSNIWVYERGWEKHTRLSTWQHQSKALSPYLQSDWNMSTILPFDMKLLFPRAGILINPSLSLAPPWGLV